MADVRHPREAIGEAAGGEEPAALALKDLVIITGFSGAGKSTAMAVFEDEGYFCVDNLPSEMIRSLVELFMHQGSKVARAAVVSDVRGGSYFEGLAAMLDDLRASGSAYRLLFLEADEQALLTRYKETRRRHPLAPTGSVARWHRPGAAAAGAAARPGRRRDRHERTDRGDAPPQARRRPAPDPHPGPPRRHLRELRLQVRPGTGPGPAARRPLPAQPPLRAEPAAADRRATGGRRVHQPRRRARRVLRPAASAARLPASSIPRRGQGPSRRRHRLHRRAPPLGGHRRAPRRALPRRSSEYLVEVVHRDIGPGG